jgi:hypothetical protein
VASSGAGSATRRTGPVLALQIARRTIRLGGTVQGVDDRAEETFTAPGGEEERLHAAAGAVRCLLQGCAGAVAEPA